MNQSKENLLRSKNNIARNIKIFPYIKMRKKSHLFLAILRCNKIPKIYDIMDIGD